MLPSGAEPLQTVVMTNASGNIRYTPSDSVLSGQDFSNFLQSAHKNTKVTGEAADPPVPTLPEPSGCKARGLPGTLPNLGPNAVLMRLV